MTTPAPPWTGTGSFQGVMHPAQVAAVQNMLVSGAAFSGTALTPYPTNRHEVAFPTARPDRPAWLGEMEDIPVIGLGDDADIVAVCKLASIVLLSNEGVTDASVNMTAQLGDLIRDSASIELDRGILYGTDSPEPKGVVAAAPPAAGADLAAALTNAVGSIGDAGGVASHLCARPSVLANLRNERDLNGVRLYPEGLGGAFGLTEVGCPELRAADVLVVDRARAWLIVRNDFQVDTSRDWAFQKDALAIRIRGRFAVGAPVLAKALRRLSVTEVPAGDEPGADEDGAPGRPGLPGRPGQQDEASRTGGTHKRGQAK
jgi:HK97 family phage major capsid protein